MQNPLDPSESLSPCLILGLAPCDDCPFRARCEVELLACESYSLFVRDLACWEGAAREPTRARYLTIFADKNDQPRVSPLRWLGGPESDKPRNPHVSSWEPGRAPEPVRPKPLNRSSALTHPIAVRRDIGAQNKDLGARKFADAHR
jgi:hypothetical protein